MPQRAVGPFPIIMFSQGVHFRFGVLYGQEPILVQALLKETQVDRLDEAVVREFPGRRKFSPFRCDHCTRLETAFRKAFSFISGQFIVYGLYAVLAHGHAPDVSSRVIRVFSVSTPVASLSVNVLS